MEHALLIQTVIICKHVILRPGNVVALRILSCLLMSLNAQLLAIKMMTANKIMFVTIELVLKHPYLLDYVKFTKIVMQTILVTFLVFVH